MSFPQYNQPNNVYKQIKTVSLNFFISILAFMVLFPLFYSIGPMIEARFFPVLTDFEISSISDYNEKSSSLDFYGTFEKVRQCHLLDFNWYAGKPDGDFVRISNLETFSWADMNFVRPLGKNHFGPWKILILPLKRYDFHVFGVAQYKCHPLWNSINIIGPIDIRTLIPSDVKQLNPFK